MATDATGAVTTPDNIPTYNTAADAPSGKGLNAIVAAIQAALSALRPSSIIGYPADATKALFGDGTWKVPTTAAFFGVELATTVLSNAAQQTIAITGTEAAPNDIVTATYTANGTDVVVVEAVIGVLQGTSGFAVGDVLGLNLWDGANDQGHIWQVPMQENSVSANFIGVYVRSGRFTPSAGAHTFKIRGWKSGVGAFNSYYQDAGIGVTAAGHNPATTMRVIKVA